MPNPAERPKESTASKLFWILAGVFITSLAAIPIAYYIVGPLTPRARVISSIADYAHRLNDNALVIFFGITNTDRHITAKDVMITFQFKRNLFPVFGVYKAADVDLEGDARCTKTVEDGNYFSFSASCVCQFINPSESRRFRFAQVSNTERSMFRPSDTITVQITYDGYTFETVYKRCDRKPNEYSDINLYYTENSSCYGL